MPEGRQTRHTPTAAITSSPSASTRTKPTTGPTCADDCEECASASGSPARKAIEPGERSVRRTDESWLSGYRRLSPRHERDPRNYLAFLKLAAAPCRHKRLVCLTT